MDSRSRGGQTAASLCRRLVLLLGLASLLPAVAGRHIFGPYYIPADKECMNAIASLYYEQDWQGYSAYKSVCKSKTVAVAMYSAMTVYCQPLRLEVNQEVMNEICQKRLKIDSIPIASLAANLTADAISALPTYTKKAMKDKENLTEAFLPDQAWFDYYMIGEHEDGVQTRLTTYYTFSHYAFWGAILIVGMLQNAAKHMVYSRRGWMQSDAEGGGQSRSAAARSTPAVLRPVVACYALLRKHVIVPGLAGSYHSRRVWGCTMPTRMESLAVGAYWVVSIVLNAQGYHSSGKTGSQVSKSAAVTDFIAERSGILCYGNLPLIWLFAGRNNVFLWLTGWSYGTFSIFHRHIARIASLQAIVHAATFVMYYYFSHKVEKKLKPNMHKLWMQLGIAALTSMLVLVGFSVGFFRVRYYDMFLLTHIVFAVLLLVFLFYHTSHYALNEWNYPLLMPVVAIWGLDRLLRVVRQVYCNVHVSRRRGKTLQATRASAGYDAATNMLHLDVVPGNRSLCVGPGQHYYLYQPLRMLGWENHPFTLADWTADSSGAMHLHFWVRPYDGWTKRLRSACERHAAQTGDAGAACLTTAMLVEGPYGQAEPLHAFDEVLFVIGGTGITSVVLYIKDHLQRVGATDTSEKPDAGRRPTRTRRITVVWADRSEKHMRRTIADSSLQQALGRDDVCFQLYLTGAGDEAGTSDSTALGTGTTGSASSESDSVAGDSEKYASVSEKHTGVVSGDAPVPANAARLSLASLVPRRGRPDVKSLVEQAAAGVRGTDSRLAIVVCGTASLADATRKAAADNMESGRDSIEFFQESFGW